MERAKTRHSHSGRHGRHRNKKGRAGWKFFGGRINITQILIVVLLAIVVEFFVLSRTAGCGSSVSSSQSE